MDDLETREHDVGFQGVGGDETIQVYGKFEGCVAHIPDDTPPSQPMSNFFPLSTSFLLQD